MHKFIVKLSEIDPDLLQDEEIECFIVPAEQVGNELKSSKIILAQGENAIEVCHQHNLDGVVVDLSKSDKPKVEMKRLRAQLGNKILGVITRNRRHEAMIISEEEPDFVIFRAWKDGLEKTKELVAWYNEFFLIQCAVMIEDDGINEADFEADIIILNK